MDLCSKSKLEKIAVSPFSNQIALCSSNGSSIPLLDLSQLQTPQILANKSSGYYDVVYHPSNPNILFAGSRNGIVFMFDTRCNTVSELKHRTNSISSAPVNASHSIRALLPCDDRLFVIHENGLRLLYDIRKQSKFLSSSQLLTQALVNSQRVESSVNVPHHVDLKALSKRPRLNVPPELRLVGSAPKTHLSLKAVSPLISSAALFKNSIVFQLIQGSVFIENLATTEQECLHITNCAPLSWGKLNVTNFVDLEGIFFPIREENKVGVKLVPFVNGEKQSSIQKFTQHAITSFAAHYQMPHLAMGTELGTIDFLTV